MFGIYFLQRREFLSYEGAAIVSQRGLMEEYLGSVKRALVQVHSEENIEVRECDSQPTISLKAFLKLSLGSRAK